MKILAFMQNMWMRDPVGHRSFLERLTIDRGAEYAEKHRRRVIRYALFAGCKSGRVLRSIFGAAMCQKIVWEEASREIGGASASVFPADIDHITQRITEEQPDIILCFGRVASNAVASLPVEWSLRTIRAPHPAARHPGVMDELRDAELALQIAVAEGPLVPSPAAHGEKEGTSAAPPVTDEAKGGTS